MRGHLFKLVIFVIFIAHIKYVLIIVYDKQTRSYPASKCLLHNYSLIYKIFAAYSKQSLES